MTEDQPLAPPSGPPRSTEPPSPSVALVQTPGVAPAPLPPPAPGLRRRRAWLLPVIVAASTLAFAGLIVLVAFGVSQLAPVLLNGGGPAAPTIEDGPIPPDEPLVEGDPGSPVAVDPLDCEECFDQYAVEFANPLQSAYIAVGTPVRHANDSFRLSVVADQRDWVKLWADDRGSPDSCYFTYPSSPMPFTPDDPGPEWDEWVYYAPSHSDADEFYYLRETSRTFRTAGDAASYMVHLAESIDACQDYSLPPSGYAAVVTPAPGIDVPDDVAAYGWVEVAGVGRYYAFDLQHGNIIVRISMFSDAYGPSELQFREFVETYAIALGDLEP